MAEQTTKLLYCRVEGVACPAPLQLCCKSRRPTAVLVPDRGGLALKNTGHSLSCDPPLPLLIYSVMRRSIGAVRSAYGPHAITIGAQAHLQALYRQLGFVPSSEEYDEDGIPHIDMTLAPASVE